MIPMNPPGGSTVMIERTGCVTFPAEKSISACFIAGIKSLMRKYSRTCCSSRKIGIRATDGTKVFPNSKFFASVEQDQLYRKVNLEELGQCRCFQVASQKRRSRAWTQPDQPLVSNLTAHP